MINTILHSDEITVWWDKQWELPDGVCYRLILNGNEIATTQKTHFSFTELSPETSYEVKVERVDGEKTAEILGIVHLTTPKAKKRLDVTEFGATGDGETTDTEAIQRTIDACGADECVYFPAGIYMSGALNLHSDMELYLEEGAILQGTAKVDDYLPRRLSRFEGLEMMCYSSLLNMGTLDHTAGPNCRNIVIRGGGAILGGGVEHCNAVIESERERLKDFLAQNADFVKTCENDRTVPGRARPRLINISNCENVVIANLTMGYAASWNVHFIYSRDILTYGCKIVSQGVWNGDGWDPDSSENCVIFGTEFKTHDNSIAIKSGKNPEGNIINRPCVGIRIFDCHGHNCMALGSEMSGGISEVYVWDCDFADARFPLGISIKVTPKRGGYMRNVRIRNCHFASLKLRCVPFNDDGEPAGTMSQVEDFLFQNIEITGGPSDEKGNSEILLLAGLDGEENHFRRFTFDGLRIHSRPDGKNQQLLFKNMKELTFKNISFI